MIPWGVPSPQPKRHIDRFSRFCRETTAVCLCTLQWDAPSPPQTSPFPWGDLDPHVIYGSLGPPESSTQMAVRSVQPFLQGSLVWQTNRAKDRGQTRDWPTDHTTRSVTTGRIYVRSSAMQPNSNNNNLILYKNQRLLRTLNDCTHCCTAVKL